LGLWLLSLLTALLATFPAALALSQLLGSRRLATPLAAGQADYLWGELLGSHATLIPSLLGSVLPALGLFWLLHTALSGGITAALLRPGHPAAAAPGQLFARAAASASAMFRLELLGLVILRLPILVVGAGAAFLLSHKQELGESTFPLIVARFAPLAVGLLLLWSMASVILQSARVRRLTQAPGSGRARRALRAALADATDRSRLLGATLRLGLLSLCGYALLVGGGRLLASRLDAGLFVGCAFVVRQLAALGRSTLALTLIAATSEAWHHQGE
jgi:hypothetical protein